MDDPEAYHIQYAAVMFKKKKKVETAISGSPIDLCIEGIFNCGEFFSSSLTFVIAVD